MTGHGIDGTGVKRRFTRGRFIWNPLFSYVFLYLAGIVSANLITARFGPIASKYTAFVFIGLDLTVLDHLHDLWHRDRLFGKMLALIGAGSMISYLLNRNAGIIGLASFAAFLCANITDRVVYELYPRPDKWEKITVSNLASALADSILFPLIAFGLPLSGDIVFGQFTAKMAGGAFWMVVLGVLFARYRSRLGHIDNV